MANGEWDRTLENYYEEIKRAYPQFWFCEYQTNVVRDEIQIQWEFTGGEIYFNNPSGTLVIPMMEYMKWKPIYKPQFRELDEIMRERFDARRFKVEPEPAGWGEW